MKSIDDQIEWEKSEGDRLLALAKFIVGVTVKTEEELHRMGDQSFRSLRRTLFGKQKFHANAEESTLTTSQRLILWAYCRRVTIIEERRSALRRS